MDEKKTKTQSAERKALADSISKITGTSGGNEEEVIENWSAKARSFGENDYERARLTIPVIQNFAEKIAEMRFENRSEAYKSPKFKEFINDLHDTDLIYGSGREYALPNFLPVKAMNPNQFVPNEVTTPINTISRITIDQPQQVNLTLQKELYLPVVNNGGNLSRFIESLKTSMHASLDCFLTNQVMENHVLYKAKNSTGALTENNQGTLSIAGNDKVSKFTDSSSNNMKACLIKIAQFLHRMTDSATNYFNIEGTNTNALYASNFDDIKILCTNKFYQNVLYGMKTGLFKPELLAPVVDKLVVVPEFKVSLPISTNTSAITNVWSNKFDDNTLILIDSKHSFVMGKQFSNTSSQYYAMNMSIQITTNYLPYYGNLKDGRMMVYTCRNLNVLPANAMENI